jgi:predicted HicB family RNase H-like nuclease
MTRKGQTTSRAFHAGGKVIVRREGDFDDINSFQGESVSEFEAGIHATIDDDLAASEELGSVPEGPASVKVMRTIAPEVHAAALKAAARSGTSGRKERCADRSERHLYGLWPSATPDVRGRGESAGTAAHRKPAGTRELAVRAAREIRRTHP